MVRSFGVRTMMHFASGRRSSVTMCEVFRPKDAQVFLELLVACAAVHEVDEIDGVSVACHDAGRVCDHAAGLFLHRVDQKLIAFGNPGVCAVVFIEARGTECDKIWLAHP